MNRFAIGLIFLCNWMASMAQVSFTANDTVVPYQGVFRPGSNLGEYHAWTEEQLADLAAGNELLGVLGVGVKALRPALHEDFLENYGYDSRVSTYQYYSSLGLKDNTVIVGFPAEEHRDPIHYCEGIPSTLFKNLYTDIWDDGANGTPVNDNNYYAVYLYKMVNLYKDQVKFWEIWNEPGFDYTKNKGWLLPGGEGNWWENNPDPCDYKLRAPIFHYVRLLRISYEVIKYIDPSAYVAVSGVGYPSFLDAILRNTDNPENGSVTEAYPNGGGAYFDVMGFHFYPHFDGSLQNWNNDRQDWDYFRHSDAAADGLKAGKDTLQSVLHKYGYNGQVFPEKEWIITECNLPRKAFGDFIGSDIAQRNFIVKTFIQAMKNDIRQLHIYKLGEDTHFDRATFEFDLMGLYQKLDRTDLYFNRPNEEGVAYQSSTTILFGTRYDPEKTLAMNLPEEVEGGAFVDEDGNYTYVLWAKTKLDQSEEVAASYSFPANWEMHHLTKREWDYALTHKRTTQVSATIQLSGTPIFLSEMKFTASILNGCVPLPVQLEASNPNGASSWQWTFSGADIASSAEKDPVINFALPGKYQISLEIKDASGAVIVSQQDEIMVEGAPEVNFSAAVSGPVVTFSNMSSTNTNNFLWDFGDGNTSTDANPTHVYLSSGSYLVKLIGSNNCDAITRQEIIDVVAPTLSLIDYSANDSMLPYQSHFRPGANIKFYPPWTDEQLADIAAGNVNLKVDGLGVKSLRSIMPEYFLKGWGYDIRLKTFRHYSNLDLSDNTITLGFPSPEARDPLSYCHGEQSQLFANMYLDIWDDGTDGTPVNEANPFALYVYHTVNEYKEYVKFWEILNAPGLDLTGEKGWLPAGEAGNWWDNDPEPCDLVIKAPVYQYIRMLRISYEVIKYLDPEAYVTMSGVGFASFLDAILRNTDNPIDGKVVPGYEKTGGAYFDAVGINVYPYIDGSTSYYDVDEGGFVFERHSDAAAGGIKKGKEKFQSVFQKYGYDGVTHPEKQWIISETNIPRRTFNGYIGSEEAQRNYIIKAYVGAMTNGFAQMYVQSISEDKTVEQASSENDLMGLYQKLEGTQPYNQHPTDEGIAFLTSSSLLYGASFDATKTEELNLPEEVAGAAFQNANGKYIYVLWAKTRIDQSEVASASYTFPATFQLSELIKRSWDYSKTVRDTTINPGDIPLSATPVFLLESALLSQPPLANWSVDTTQSCAPITVQFTDLSQRGEDRLWSFPGGLPETSVEPNPIVTYPMPGSYTVGLKVSNEAGTHTFTKHQYIMADSVPVADFVAEMDGPWGAFRNASINATGYLWDFGDGNESLAFDPDHFYFENGEYLVRLIAWNDCGADTTSQVITIQARPFADFNAQIPESCGPFEVQFQDLSAASPTQWSWYFTGGQPESSAEENPLVIFDEAGEYEVRLITSNEFGKDTISKVLSLNAGTIYYYESSICFGESVEINGVSYNKDNPTGTQVLAGQSHLGCDSTIMISLNVVEEVTHLDETIDEGESFIVGNSVYTTSGTYVDTLMGALGCDSIVYLDLTVLITATKDALSQKIGLKYFPNPFQNAFTIKFELHRPEQVSFLLYDIYGRMVYTVFENSYFHAGSHQVEVDGQYLAPGIYYGKFILSGEFTTHTVIKM